MTSSGPQQPSGRDHADPRSNPLSEGGSRQLPPEVTHEIAKLLQEAGMDIRMWMIVIPDFLSECARDLDKLFKSRYDELHTLMGDRFVVPQSKIFAGYDLGLVMPPSRKVLEYLSEPCDLARDGRKRWETHIGAVIPERLGAAPTSVMALREFAEATERKRTIFAPLRSSTFYGEPWYQGDRFAQTPVSVGRCVFAYEQPMPGTTTGSEQERRGRVYHSPHHRLASAVEAAGILSLHTLEHRKRYFGDVYGLTSDRGLTSRTIWVGLNGRDGLAIEGGIIPDFPAGSGAFGVLR